MKGKKILQYKKRVGLNVSVFFVELQGDRPNEIEDLKNTLGGYDYHIWDHTIKDSHIFYTQYVMELDGCGYIYLKKKKDGIVKIKRKGVLNLTSSFKTYKSNIIKVLNNYIEEHGQLKLMASKSKRKVWTKLLRGLGYKVEETFGLYRKRILVISK
mgnify:CR=1 FL=1